jgi:hypothetical protein
VTLHDRPAFLTPMPMLGSGAPATLLEWQAILNGLRGAALAAAGVSIVPGVETQEQRAEEARRSVYPARGHRGCRALGIRAAALF